LPKAHNHSIATNQVQVDFMETNFWKIIVALQLSALVLGLASCGGVQSSGSGQGGGGGGNGPSAGEYLWEFSLSDETLYVSTINTDTGQLGTPTASGGVACNSSGTIPSIAVSPSNNFMFVIDKCLVSIHVYAMSGPGVALQEIPESPYLVTNVLESIAIDPSGKFLYAIGNDPDAIYQISVDGSTGELTFNSTTMLSNDVRQVVVEPQGGFLFVNDLGGGKILAYSIGGEGILSPVSGSPFNVPANGQPENMVIDSGGRFIYAPLLQGGIAAFAVNPSTGVLADVAGSPFPTSNLPFTMAIAPSAEFLYSIGGHLNNAIDAFSIDAETGALTPIGGSPFAAPNSLTSLAVDASDGFLYATVLTDMQADSMVFGFAIDSSDGGLTALATSPYPAPAFPVDALSLNIP
jgi:6-phosphogluconolactonase (cycloisomerase 2 family)